VRTNPKPKHQHTHTMKTPPKFKSYGVQIFNWITELRVCPVEIEAKGWELIYRRSNYHTFIRTGKFTTESDVYGVGKCYFENMESAVEHILAGRQISGDYPNLVTDSEKVKAIQKCRNLFDRFKKLEKVAEFEAEKKAKLEALQKEEMALFRQRMAIRDEIESFKMKTLGLAFV